MSYTGELLNEEFAKTVYLNGTTPATSTIFSENNPPTVHDAVLMADDSNIFIASDGSSWAYKNSTTSYSTYVYPTTVPRGVTAQANSVSIPSGPLTPLTSFATPLMDTSSGAWNNSTGVYTVNRAGIYRLDFRAMFANASFTTGGEIAAQIQRNGVTIYNASNFIERTATQYGMSGHAYATLQCSVGNTLRVLLYQNSGGARTLYAPTFNILTIIEIR
jgi:hypothetical protein